MIERARCLSPEIPIVVTTAYPDALEADHPLVVNSCQVLRKSIDSAILVHTVCGILGGAVRKEKTCRTEFAGS